MLFVVYLLIATFILNISIPKVAAYFAKPEEINPPKGPNNLSYKGQMMHMLVHHSQTPLSSSIVTFVMVFLTYRLAQYLKAANK